VEESSIGQFEIDHTQEVEKRARFTVKVNDWLFVFLEDSGKYTLILIKNKRYKRALKKIEKVRKDRPVQVLTGGYDMTDYELYHYTEILDYDMCKVKPVDFCDVELLNFENIYKNNLKMLLLTLL